MKWAPVLRTLGVDTVPNLKTGAHFIYAFRASRPEPIDRRRRTRPSSASHCRLGREACHRTAGSERGRRRGRGAQRSAATQQRNGSTAALALSGATISRCSGAHVRPTRAPRFAPDPRGRVRRSDGIARGRAQLPRRKDERPGGCQGRLPMEIQGSMVHTNAYFRWINSSSEFRLSAPGSPGQERAERSFRRVKDEGSLCCPAEPRAGG